MRSSEPRGGNSTNSFVSQRPLLEFSWVDDSLSEGSAKFIQSMAARPSGKIAAAEREGCDSPLWLEAECPPASREPRRSLIPVTVLTCLNRLRNVLLHEGKSTGFYLTLSIATILKAGCLHFPLANVPRLSAHDDTGRNLARYFPHSYRYVLCMISCCFYRPVNGTPGSWSCGN